MSEHLQNIMESDDSEEVSAEESVKTSTGGDRINSIMDMDYDSKDEIKDPEDTKIKEETLPKIKDEKDEKEEKESKDKKEEKKDSKEEKKEEAEKKKFKIKVDGQEVEEEFDEEQIKSALSGQKAIQKRFTELDQQKKSFQKEQETFKTDLDFIKSEMKGIKDGFSADIEEFKQNGFVKGNPIKSVYNLLDKMGLDASQFEKAVFFHHLPEAAKFLDMGDAERDAFLLGRENEWLKKNQDALKNKEREVSEHRAKLEQENSIKRQAGVSEELFSELKEELIAKGLENLKTEQVLEWHKVKPTFLRAEAMAQKVPGTDINKVAKILLEFPETTDEWMLEQLGYKQVQEKEIAKELAAKAPPKPKAAVKDDDDKDDLFDSFRGRGRFRA